MIGRVLLTGLLLFACLGSAGCGEDKTPAVVGSNEVRTGPLVVVTTVEANRYLAMRIGGDRVDVRFPVPAEADPLTWEPGREAIALIQSADLLLLNGAGLEVWRERVTVRPSATITLADAYRDQWLTFSGSVEHQHGPEGSHTHTGTDPHVWLDPELLKEHVTQIVAAFASRDTEHADEYRARGAALSADLDDLDARFRGEEGKTMPPLLANHPAYDYAARRYGWSIENYDLDPEEPLAALVIEQLGSSGRKFILWESAPLAETKSALAARGVDSIVIAPCEQPPETGDWLTVMRENARKLADLAE